MIRGAVISLSAEKLGNLYQPGRGGGGSTLYQLFGKFSKHVRGSPVPTLKKPNKRHLFMKNKMLRIAQKCKININFFLFDFGVPTRGDGGGGLANSGNVRIETFFLFCPLPLVSLQFSPPS